MGPASAPDALRCSGLPGTTSCLVGEGAPHPELSSPARAGDPAFRRRWVTEPSRRTGFSAFAGYDGVHWRSEKGADKPIPALRDTRLSRICLP
jgi:hypothetical protein